MCGIFAYQGSANAGALIINGLKRLEYRGYDSWGIALLDGQAIFTYKQVGPIGEVDQLPSLPLTHCGIGHTRWATHGGVTINNAHPHLATDRSFALAQNGIVENYQDLKRELTKEGYLFSTETDTEVIVRLVEKEYKATNDLIQAVRRAFKRLKGRNTIIVVSQAGEIIAVRHGSPLVVGQSADGLFLASDTLSFANHTRQVFFIENQEMVTIQKGELNFLDVQTGKRIRKQSQQLPETQTEVNKDGFDSFYIKEVQEQPQTLAQALLTTAQEFSPFLKSLRQARHLYTLGAGSASFAASLGAYHLRANNLLNVTELKAYEVESYLPLFGQGDLLITVSQSGETADVLSAVAAARARGVQIASLVNMLGSTLSRESDFPFFTRSGPEISVVSTKAFTAQVMWFFHLSAILKNQSAEFSQKMAPYLAQIDEYFKKPFQQQVARLAHALAPEEHIYILGRDQFLPIAQEAAMKIKEISYLHAEAFAAGELKHGVIALISQNTPVMGILSGQEGELTLNALAEVKARGARIIGVSPVNHPLFDQWIKTIPAPVIQPLMNIIPVQLLGYYLAQEKGLSPDKPRNLAKSVTVE